MPHPIKKILANSKYFLKAHVFNPVWLPRGERRMRRQFAYADMKTSLLEKYIPFIKSLTPPGNLEADKSEEPEKIFSLWFQGEENAPEIVKRCLNSIRKRYPDNFIVLDDHTFRDLIDLPEFIMKKWEDRKIVAPNFSDIVRIELLYQFGGYWFDATDFMIAPIPEIIRKSDFFMYVTDKHSLPHMFVQTCFMRAKRRDPLLAMWRSLIFEYWKQEDKAIDYFLVHFLFKMLVTHNEEAARLYEEMPKLQMEPTHRLWYHTGDLPFDRDEYNKMIKETFFQKCSYKKQKRGLREIVPGSMADFVFNKAN